ncbi:conserved hypothetical protein [Neospora caninum Liverpool]|uniref:Uncharacterized protein n=1 Tax=Neospora caninum (strain Liverpool) TaxID=572307 RepID=F0VGV1_NEOCL|nr:conserved hypothetical protein [Neospora caninum Liverpool]CBZ52945.1 conserved hypothetical protein [Neospora caninum Liverpool]|eukprot:XP_003882977.1 conserved hypothetical protein [Neospora caninum Liverpool]
MLSVAKLFANSYSTSTTQNFAGGRHTNGHQPRSHHNGVSVHSHQFPFFRESFRQHTANEWRLVDDSLVLVRTPRTCATARVLRSPYILRNIQRSQPGPSSRCTDRIPFFRRGAGSGLWPSMRRREQVTFEGSSRPHALSCLSLGLVPVAAVLALVTSLCRSAPGAQGRIRPVARCAGRLREGALLTEATHCVWSSPGGLSFLSPRSCVALFSPSCFLASTASAPVRLSLARLHSVAADFALAGTETTARAGERRTQLCMTRSRSKPIYRAPHPGLKQLILREKFWTRFDPNRNKLVHTPEYQELLVAERRRALQRKVDTLANGDHEGGDPEGLEKGGAARDRQASRLSAYLTDPKEEHVELSAEQKRAMHRREVGYLQQQPKFRQKKWGSGRFRKEEGYLFRLLESHRKKLREHEMRKRQRQLAAARLTELSQALSGDDDCAEGQETDTEETLTVEEERQRRKIVEANKDLSYSFVITQVVPCLARVEKRRLRGAVEAWHHRMERSPNRGEAEMGESDPASLLHQVQRLHQKKNLYKGPQQVLSVYEQQQMLLGNVGFVDPLAERKRRSGAGRHEEDERFLGRLRLAAARTRSIYLQFLVDLHFIFTSFEEFLTDGLEALLNAPRSAQDGSDAPEETRETREAGRDEEGGDVASHGSPSDAGERGERWRNRQQLEEFVSTLSFQRGVRSADDVFAMCHLLKRNPPAPSAEAQVFILRLADLMQKDFIRALSRIYHFHKEWSVAGRFFLAAVTTRQQLLPKKLKLTMWDADTDSLELAIDVVSLSWTPAEKDAFLDELQFADADAEAALAQPLLDGIRAGLHAVMEDENLKRRKRRPQKREKGIDADGSNAEESPEGEVRGEITLGENHGSSKEESRNEEGAWSEGAGDSA